MDTYIPSSWISFLFRSPQSIEWYCFFVVFFNEVEWKLSTLWVSEVAQSCPILCDLMDCSLPGSSVSGIFQARVLEWVAISFSRGTSWPRDWTQASHIVGRHFTTEPPGKSPVTLRPTKCTSWSLSWSESWATCNYLFATCLLLRLKAPWGQELCLFCSTCLTSGIAPALPQVFKK